MDGPESGADWHTQMGDSLHCFGGAGPWLDRAGLFENYHGLDHRGLHSESVLDHRNPYASPSFAYFVYWKPGPGQVVSDLTCELVTNLLPYKYATTCSLLCCQFINGRP